MAKQLRSGKGVPVDGEVEKSSEASTSGEDTASTLRELVLSLQRSEARVSEREKQAAEDRRLAAADLRAREARAEARDLLAADAMSAREAQAAEDRRLFEERMRDRDARMDARDAQAEADRKAHHEQFTRLLSTLQLGGQAAGRADGEAEAPRSGTSYRQPRVTDAVAATSKAGPSVIDRWLQRPQATRTRAAASPESDCRDRDTMQSRLNDFPTETSNADINTRRWINSNPYGPHIDHHAVPQQRIRYEPVPNAMFTRMSGDRELTPFSGDAMEWPVFYSQYTGSTRLYELSPTENLLRLQKALRGDAKKTVQRLLHDPRNLDSIISTLKLRYGRPEIIVAQILDEVKKLPRLGPNSTPDQLTTLSIEIQNIVAAVENQNPAYLTLPQLLNELVSKLPLPAQMFWTSYTLADNSKTTIHDFSKWLMTLCYQAPLVGMFDVTTAIRREQPQRREGRVHTQTDLKSPPTGKCIKCKKDHNLADCGLFKQLSVHQRWDEVKAARICYLCFKRGHRSDTCRAKKCGTEGCNRNHHALLHAEKNAPEERREAFVAHTKHTDGVLLKIVPVTIRGPQGFATTHALLDEGSTLSLIDNTLIEKIGATGPVTELRIHGTMGMCASDKEARRVKIGIAGDKGEYNVQMFAIHHLDLPLQLSSGLLRTRVKPQILLGQDNAHLIVSRSFKRVGPYLKSKTALGWTLHGGANKTSSGTSLTIGTTLHISNDQNLEAIVRTGFAVDSLGVTAYPRTTPLKMRRAEELMKNTTQKLSSGHWETGLLWKEDISCLPANKDCALKRLVSLENKFEKDPILAAAYKEKINDYHKKGYAQEVDEDMETSNPRKWYLPHFAVINPNKPGKIRVVFDAASRCRGTALNDLLLTGPDMLTSLLGNILRFRRGKIALSADIKEMFLRIKIRPEDQGSQLFLWRESPGLPVKTMKLTSMMFGATCSPSSAQFVRNQVAEAYRSTCPEAADAITSKFYMDDYLDAVETPAEAVKLVTEVTAALEKGGFHITNWASNSPSALKHLPEQEKQAGIITIAKAEQTAQRVLGVMWNPATDKFTFHLQQYTEITDWPTKREMLSEIMKIFDPAGFIACLTVRSRILLQEVWRSKISWDEKLSERHQAKWRDWVTTLRASSCTIPRCTLWNKTADATLHVFCDASESACCTVAYRTETENGETRVSFIASKCKVTPLKPLSVPRLELQAALMAARLAVTIKLECGERDIRTIYWSDSRTVLHWIRSDPLTYSVFVANRLGEIDDTTSVEDWRWVPTKENPADIGTRDTSDLDLSEKGRWFSGPPFIRRPSTEWPTEKATTKTLDAASLEIRPQYVGLTSEHPQPLPQAVRFSRRIRLLRATAWQLRFINNTQKKHLKRSGALSASELNVAELTYLRHVQSESFKEEIQSLQQKIAPGPKSRLFRLTPKINSLQILAATTRLENLPGFTDPAILDGAHTYTRLLIADIHERAGHAGIERTIADLREHYFIVRLRNAVRQVLHKCQHCKIARSKPAPPMMGPLPLERLSQNERPFSKCGLDLFGPVYITVGRRREKRYGVLFTCMTTRAVHLELACSLSSDSTIMAIQRMTARRGQPTMFYSDNGTNFHGSNSEIRQAFEELRKDPRLLDELANNRSQWSFTPPSSPHMGGVWERLVRSVKRALEATLKERFPKEETLMTALAEAEHIVNSRPLTHVSTEPGEEWPLTPNHFLIGTASIRPRLALFDKKEEDVCLRKQWRTAQQIADGFWRRWLKEYLPTIAGRQKWHTPATPIKEGDLVIITDPSLPRNSWPKGVVVGVSSAADGQTRVVRVKTAEGRLYTRPAVKVAVLPVQGSRPETAAPELST